MFYFTHPQLKLRIGNLTKIIKAFVSPPSEHELKQKLASFFPDRELVFTDMGRTAFRLILQELKLKNCEMIVPAFICEIFYPILKEFNIAPIFLDIDLKTFNVKPSDIENAITEQTKAILVSHTYGLPNDMMKILSLAKKHNLLVIEDCAHAFGAKIQNKYLGNFSHAAFVSLYKQFPTLRGGMAILPKNTGRISLLPTRFNLRDFVSLLNYYHIFSFLFKTLGSSIAPKFLRKEKHSGGGYVGARHTESGQAELGRINKVSLNLFNFFLADFQKSLKNRTVLALDFSEKLSELKFRMQKPGLDEKALTYGSNVFTFLSGLMPNDLEQKRDELVKKLRKIGVFATRIWHTPIILNKKAQKECQIDLQQFPNAVLAAKRIINFPLQNCYTQKDIDKMTSKLKTTLNKIRT